MCQPIWWSGQGILHEPLIVKFDKREALWLSMQFDIELMYTFGITAFELISILFFFTNWLWYGNLVLVGISLQQQIQFNVKDSLEQTWPLGWGLTVCLRCISV